MEQNNQNNQSVMPVETPAKKPTNPLVVFGLIYALVVVGLVGAIIAVKMTRSSGPKNNSNAIVPVVATEPSMELAEAVCKKYGGESKYLEDGELDGQTYVVDAFGCEKADDDEDTIASDEFGFAIEFYDEDYADTVKKMQATFLATSGQYEVLGYSEDGFFKGYTEVNSPVIQYEVVDKNAYVKVFASKKTLAENLLAELGFLDGERADDDNDEDGGSEPQSLEPGKSKERDTLRKDDYAMLVIAVNNYLANNRGTFSDMVNEDNDPRALTATKWISSTGEDPNGNNYELKAYSYNKWQSEGELVPGISDSTDGSQVFVIIRANCDGIDGDGNPMPDQDAGTRSFVVYGHLENGTYCQASGSVSS